MAFPATWVEAPPRPRRPNTILDVVPVRDAPAHFAGVQFQVDGCAFPANLPTDACIITIGPAPGTKSFAGIENVITTGAFGTYAGVECFLNGGLDEFEAEARRILENGEYRAVENQVIPLLATGATVTGGTTIVSLLAALETALATNVPGQGYIYLTPAMATLAASQNLLIRNLDGTLETYLGTPIVVLTTPGVSQAFASGPITLWRNGEITANTAPILTTNKGRALAERLWAASIECGSWKATGVAPAAGDPPENPPEALEMILGSIPSSPIPDGTDTTIIVQTNVSPQEEVFLWYSVNGGADTEAGEMTQTQTHEFVWNVIGDSTTTGDSVEVWAVSDWDNAPVESNHITIEVT